MGRRTFTLQLYDRPPRRLVGDLIADLAAAMGVDEREVGSAVRHLLNATAHEAQMEQLIKSASLKTMDATEIARLQQTMQGLNLTPLAPQGPAPASPMTDEEQMRARMKRAFKDKVQR